MTLVYICSAAFILDMLIGDPPWLPHPIVLIGKTIGRLEPIMRRFVKKEFWGGAFLAVIVSSLSFTIPTVILITASKIHVYLAFAIETFFCFQILAAKSLKKESMKVYYPLAAGNLADARKALSYIVGRETENLDEAGIIKATVETVAENTTDGVVAPLFYMVIGGAPLAFFYKAVNTMDSMIGYKNEKYILFGRFAAKLDDAANLLPARITALFMIMASAVLRFDFKNAVKVYHRDRRKHKSPNAAQTESVCAGALGIQLAGNASYSGQLVIKPVIGDKLRDVKAEDIILVNRLMYMASIIGAAALLFLRSLFYLKCMII